MFTVELIGDKAVVGRLDSLPERLREALRSTLTELAMRVQAAVQVGKLQGQVLQHRTGKLSRSIENEIESNPEGILARVFSNGTAPYAAAHEFGFSGAESVGGYMQRRTMVFGRAIDPIVVPVSAYSRTMHMPERSFLRSTLREQAAAIEKALVDTVARVVADGI